MSRNLGGWIHSFTVTDAVTHTKGYTIYKITSIVFPRSVPEALTCITVWKRFHEIKKLYRDLLKRHKTLKLNCQIPVPKKSNNYFKRFDPEIIKIRKEYILELLDFVAQHPALYKSYAFLNFFENSHTPNTSPLHHNYYHQRQHQSNIEEICDNLDLSYDNEINLIDPIRDKENNEEQENETSVTNQKEHQQDTNVKKIQQFIEHCKLQNDENNSNVENIENRIFDNKIIKLNNNDTSRAECSKNRILIPTISFEGGDNDYIFEAAYEFSQAVQFEVNQEYHKAYEKYKSGVEKLLTGSKDDLNDERTFIAKAKVTKYMNRAEELYEKYLSNIEDNKKTVQLSIDIADSSKKIYLERPWNQLSKFKVLQIIDTVMKVQDVTDKSIYIMKSIEKPSIKSARNDSVFLPQDVPYMVQLLGFFQSDTKIYLLLHQAKGGKLFDYIHTYNSFGHITSSLNEIFTEIQHNNKIDEKYDKKDNENSIVTQIPSNNYDSDFLELLNEYKINNENVTFATNQDNLDNEDTVEKKLKDQNTNTKDYVPSFDILSENMDVNDLLLCSQKLIQSVSNTLEQLKETNIDNHEVLEKIKNTINDDDNTKNKFESTKIAYTISLSSLNVNKKFNNMQLNNEIQINKQIVIPEVSIKQWARELVTAIHSLHQKGVILGDLRPDNLLLGSKGQLLLSYFYQNESLENYDNRNYINFIAKENLYVAPERPLTIKSDWWSFGVILFELLTGYTFKLCHPGNLSCYFEIQYPDDIDISHPARDLLNRTIQYNPENRISINDIKTHKFFEGTNWNDIAKRGINCF